jgi:type IV secretory pathway ATPase VirB11/archaellum biosynthesis ATPase
VFFKSHIRNGHFSGFLIHVTSHGNLSMGCFLYRLISEIQKHSTVIIIGETGSGKTTQIPQFMHEVRLDRNGIIGITQVRFPICFLKTVKIK